MPATLVIDGLDATRMSAPSKPLLTTLGRLPPRWRLVATARAFDLKHSPDWKKLFAERLWTRREPTRTCSRSGT